MSLAHSTLSHGAHEGRGGIMQAETFPTARRNTRSLSRSVVKRCARVSVEFLIVVAYFSRFGRCASPRVGTTNIIMIILNQVKNRLHEILFYC